MSYCVNCGNDLNYHSETQTDRCLKQLNQKVIELYEFDKKIELEGRSLPISPSSLTIPNEVDICG